MRTLVVGTDDGAVARRRSFAHWLLSSGEDLPPDVRLALFRSLYGSIAIFLGGVVSTFTVAMILALRIGTPIFALWVALEALLAAWRYRVLIACRREVARGRTGPAGLYGALSLLWAGSVGFGGFIAVASGDWVAALVACVSSAAMLGGICFRYFAAPRLVCAMLCAMGLPGAAACLMSGEPLLLVAAAQVPLYVAAMTSAARTLNRTLVTALCAERDQAERARTDPLTGLLNRAGLATAMSARPAREALACFFVDLDGFKGVNDRLGHRAGDQLLAQVADRLREAAGSEAILARLGGDEFIVIRACACRRDAYRWGETIASAASGLPYIVDDQGVFVGASVGAAIGRPEAFEDMIAQADAALYLAKERGRSTCMVAGDEDYEQREAA